VISQRRLLSGRLDSTRFLPRLFIMLVHVPLDLSVEVGKRWNTVLQPERERVLLPRTATGIHRPVQIQKDVNGVLKETDGAMRLLSNSALVIVR
jgi:hypothetical protein